MPPRSTSVANRALIAGWLSVALSACAYVSPSEVEDKIDTLDHDGDGAPYGGPAEKRDCDDFNDQVKPGLDEVPYDGLDNDCVDGDVVDVDGDGFPGISASAYLEAHPDAPWPSGVSEDAVDCRDDPAAHPKAKSIYPGASDAPYDGVDSDCAGDTDFDVDGDTYLPDRFLFNGQAFDTREAFDAYVAEWGYDLGTPTYGDCDDFEPDVNPGVPASEDAWYDGTDANCDGWNDFDQDGDGFMPDEALYAVAYENFVDAYFDGAPPWGDPQWGDCLDHEVAGITAQPDTVYPGAVDAWYDGVDSNCAGDNDFDQDLDEVMPDVVPGGDVPTLFAAYEAAWGYTFDDVFGDCDDTEPTVSPGALERLGDALDGDCDGDVDFTPWGFGSYTWERPRATRVVGTLDHYVLSTAADEADFGATAYDDVGVYFVFEQPNAGLGKAGAGYLATPKTTLPWQGSANPVPLGDVAASVAVDDAFWVAVAFTQVNGVMNLIAKQYEYDTQLDLYLQRRQELTSTQYQFTASDLDMVVDADGNPWFTACAYGHLVAMKGTGVPLGAPSQVLGNLPINCTNDCTVLGPPADICFPAAEPDPATNVMTLHACEDGVDCQTFDFDASALSLTSSATQPLAGRALSAGDYRDGWYLLTDAAGGAEVVSADLTAQYRVFGTEPLLSFDAVWYGGELWAVGVVDGFTPTIELRWGDPSVDADADGVADLASRVVPFDDPARPELVVASAGIHVDADRIVMSVTANHPTLPLGDAVGWIFLGWP